MLYFAAFVLPLWPLLLCYDRVVIRGCVRSPLIVFVNDPVSGAPVSHLKNGLKQPHSPRIQEFFRTTLWVQDISPHDEAISRDLSTALQLAMEGLSLEVFCLANSTTVLNHNTNWFAVARRFYENQCFTEALWQTEGASGTMKGCPTGQACFSLTHSFQHIRNPSVCDKTRKENQKDPDWKKETKLPLTMDKWLSIFSKRYQEKHTDGYYS